MRNITAHGKFEWWAWGFGALGCRLATAFCPLRAACLLQWHRGASQRLVSAASSAVGSCAEWPQCPTRKSFCILLLEPADFVGEVCKLRGIFTPRMFSTCPWRAASLTGSREFAAGSMFTWRLPCFGTDTVL